MAKLADLKEFEHNPRRISKKDFNKLKKSLQEFPEMLEARELVVDENNVILGGNQRYKALLALGETTAPVKRVQGWSDEQKRQFVIKDNVSNGDWDYDLLANEWDADELSDWGMDIDNPSNSAGAVDDDPLDDDCLDAVIVVARTPAELDALNELYAGDKITLTPTIKSKVNMLGVGYAPKV